MAKKKTTTKAKSTALTLKKPDPNQFVSIEYNHRAETDQLLRMAVDKNLDVDKLAKLIELKNAEEARLAKKDFDLNFGLMQNEFPTVRKSKDVKNRSGALLYRYCPLENIIKVLGPIIKKHGFSYWFSSEMVNKDEMRIYCHISGWGYEKVNHIDFPVIPGTDATNKIQERGITETYGQRYAFKAGFGFVIAGEDNDAQTVDYEEPRKVGEQPKPVNPESEKILKEYRILYDKIKKSPAFSLIEQRQIKSAVECLKNNPAELQASYDEWNAAYNERNE